MMEYVLHIDPKEYGYKGKGCIDVEFDPDDFDLIPEDEIDDHVDEEDVIANMSSDDLIQELENRGSKYEDDELETVVRQVMEKSKSDARLLLCDVIGISHLSTPDQILDNLKRYL